LWFVWCFVYNCFAMLLGLFSVACSVACLCGVVYIICFGLRALCFFSTVEFILLVSRISGYCGFGFVNF
jgi:hypothetical protein